MASSLLDGIITLTLIICTTYLFHLLLKSAFLLDIRISTNHISIVWADPHTPIANPENILIHPPQETSQDDSAWQEPVPGGWAQQNDENTWKINDAWEAATGWHTPADHPNNQTPISWEEHWAMAQAVVQGLI